MDTLTRESTGPDGSVWHLTPADRALVETKSRVNRLRFAALLMFFRDRGRFPRVADEIGPETMAALAGVLGVPIPAARLALDPPAVHSKGSGRKSARCSTSVRRPLPTPRLSARGFATTLSRNLATTIG